jgi:hypothetical protein
METFERRRSVVDINSLPTSYPTHRHSPLFWEWLGRAVATFGFLEETLGKAIFAMTGTRQLSEEQAKAEYEVWFFTLKKALSDPLGNLIDSYDKAVRANSAATITNLDNLISDLRTASSTRNVLCHGSWPIPDANGKCIPFFVNRKGEIFSSAIDIEYLEQVQRHVLELCISVINTVTHMGWRFPGTSGPGCPILS